MRNDERLASHDSLAIVTDVSDVLGRARSPKPGLEAEL
jgi:hypothetical protein